MSLFNRRERDETEMLPLFVLVAFRDSGGEWIVTACRPTRPMSIDPQIDPQRAGERGDGIARPMDSIVGFDMHTEIDGFVAARRDRLAYALATCADAWSMHFDKPAPFGELINDLREAADGQ